jgi:hypothetical protein
MTVNIPHCPHWPECRRLFTHAAPADADRAIQQHLTTDHPEEHQ